MHSKIICEIQFTLFITLLHYYTISIFYFIVEISHLVIYLSGIQFISGNVVGVALDKECNKYPVPDTLIKTL